MDNQNKTQESLLSRHRKTTLRFSPHPKPRSMTVRVLHHPTEPAVARCARCGKYICKDCAEAYTVTDGEYATNVCASIAVNSSLQKTLQN